MHPILTKTLSLRNLGESQKVRMDDSIESTNQLQKKEKLTKLETKIEVEVNSEKREIEILKLTTPDGKDSKNNVEVDFSTPYNSPEQEKKWRSWGKDIDWGKMKFQGGSEIYTRAQEGGIGGIVAGKSSRKTKDMDTEYDRMTNESVGHESAKRIKAVEGKEKGRESVKEKIISDAVQEKITSTRSVRFPSPSPHHDQEKDREEGIISSSGETSNTVWADAQKKRSIAYAVASSSDNEVCDVYSLKAALTVDAVNEESQKSERNLSHEAVTAVMFVKECSNIDIDIDVDRVIDSGKDGDSQGFLHTDRWKAPIRSPVAAQVLVPPMLSGEYYLWGGEVPPNTIPTVPMGEREKKDKSASSFINCFKARVPNSALTGAEKDEDSKTDPQRMTSVCGSIVAPFSSFESESRMRPLAGSPSSSASPGRQIATSGSHISPFSALKDIRSTLDGISSPLLERGLPSPFTMSTSSSSNTDRDISMMTAAERKAEGRDCIQWVEGVILKAKSNEIRERVEKINKQRSSFQTEDTYRSEVTVGSAYGSTVVRGDRISSTSSSSSSIYYNADISSSSPAYSSRSFPMK